MSDIIAIYDGEKYTVKIPKFYSGQYLVNGCETQSEEIVTTTSFPVVKHNDTTYNIVIKNKIDIPTKFITPYRHIDGNIMSLQGIYNRMECMVFETKKYLSSLGFREANSSSSLKTYKEYSLTNSSYNETIRIYIGKNFTFDWQAKQISDDLDVLITQYNKDIIYIKGFIDHYLNTTNTTLNVRDAVDTLKKIKHDVDGLVVFKREQKHKKAVLASIETIISDWNKVEEEILGRLSHNPKEDSNDPPF